MIGRDWRLEYSERFYGVLLSLYPAAFRARFGHEMLQWFRDSYLERVQDRGTRRFLALWVDAFSDLAPSLVREQRRALICPISASHPVVALVDSLLIPFIIGINLMVLGPVTTALLLHLEPAKVSPDEFLITSAMASLVLGGLGILRAVLVARLRPSVRLWVKLS